MRSDSPGHPELRQGILGDEQCGLCDAGLSELFGCRGVIGICGKDCMANIPTQILAEQFAAMVNGIPIDRFGFIQLPSHVHPLRSLAGEHENRFFLYTHPRCVGTLIVTGCSEFMHCFLVIPADDRPAVGETVSPGLERECHIRQ